MNAKNKLKKFENVDIGKLGKSLEKFPVPDALAFFKMLADAYKEEQITKREIEKIHAIREVLIEQTRNKHDIIRTVCESIFTERKIAIDKIFSVIDKGIESNNTDVITKGLESLSEIVKESPFKDIQSISNLLESGGKIEM